LLSNFQRNRPAGKLLASVSFQDTSTDGDLWTLDKLRLHVLKVKEGILQTPTEIRGVVDYAVWDFIDVINFVYPVLHAEIGLANAALDGFYDVLDDKIESMTVDEKKARTKSIFADIKLDNAKRAQEEWNKSHLVHLEMNRIEKLHIAVALKPRGLPVEERNKILTEKREVDESIKVFMNERKAIQDNIALKRKAFSAAKKH
jgi:hypothetical protein